MGEMTETIRAKWLEQFGRNDWNKLGEIIVKWVQILEYNELSNIVKKNLQPKPPDSSMIDNHSSNP